MMSITVMWLNPACGIQGGVGDGTLYPFVAFISSSLMILFIKICQFYEEILPVEGTSSMKNAFVFQEPIDCNKMIAGQDEDDGCIDPAMNVGRIWSIVSVSHWRKRIYANDEEDAKGWTTTHGAWCATAHEDIYHCTL